MSHPYNNTYAEIDDILFTFGETGLIPTINTDYNIIDEMRSYIGEEKFLAFLKYSSKMWGIELPDDED